MEDYGYCHSALRVKSAFTLAEVLITLAIIGVVAAITIPTLMTSTRGKEFEVGANKAMSTLANAMQMKYALDGVTLADFVGQRVGMQPVLDYLIAVSPNARQGEQPALPIIAKGAQTVKIKDGAILITAVSCTSFGGSTAARNPTAFVVMDTNGEKGPTRTNLNSTYNGGTVTCDFASAVFNLNVKINGVSITLVEQNTAPTENNNPDLVVFAIDGHSGAVRPLGVRSRNIVATGNAMISN